MRLIDAEDTKKLAQEHLIDPYHIISVCAVIDKAETADVAPVVRCRECIMHGNCTTEDVFNCSGMDMDEAFCCAGKRKNGDVNGKLSMPPQLREAEGAKLWEV